MTQQKTALEKWMTLMGEERNQGSTLLSVENLSVSFQTKDGEVQAVRGVSFSVRRGEILGIVGESGSGKSVTSMSILRLLAPGGRIKEGRVLYAGQDIHDLSAGQMRRLRGESIAMIFQDPMSSLNPLTPVGRQIGEMLSVHNKQMSREEIKQRVIQLMELVRIPEAAKRYRAYPHEFSGGMRQRIMIAMAIACNPRLLIADEPTTALDVTIQNQILRLLKGLQREMDMGIIFITHDLGVVAQICHRVAVMYGGMIMEEGPVEAIFDNPRHPYTMGLLASVPGVDLDRAKALLPIPGSPPDMLRPPKGCPFAARCSFVRNICMEKLPPYQEEKEAGVPHRSMCWLLHPDAPADADNPFSGKRPKEVV